MSEFPGAKSNYVTDMFFSYSKPEDRIPVFHIMNNSGEIVKEDYNVVIPDAELVSMYKQMLTVNAMDQIFYDAQRQGRISFYMTASGEEGIHIGCGSALDKEDVIFSQYREAGVLLNRGFTLNQFAHQLFGTHKDLGKGRQMPVHYGSKALNFHTISSPLATQIPQAVGAAHGLVLEGKTNNIVVCFFGEGAASEGDFHAGMNFAVTLSAPVMFFCRNNGYAISTPTSDQYGGDGIAARAVGYGMHTIRVDGNDILAVREATAAARKYIIDNQKPCLVEAMTYRAGHHSTSDDSTRYRDVAEIQHWQTYNNPITRFRNLLESRGLWSEDREVETRTNARKEVLDALNDAEMAKKPPTSQLFTDVYDKLPHHLVDQQNELKAHLAKYGQNYNLAEFLPEEDYVDPGKL